MWRGGSGCKMRPSALTLVFPLLCTRAITRGEKRCTHAHTRCVSRARTAGAAFPRGVQDVVTPLVEMPYASQLKRKEHDLRRVYLRLARRARKAWGKHARQAEGGADVSMPQWMVPVEGRHCVEVVPIKAAGSCSADVAGYRNKCDFGVGSCGRGGMRGSQA